MSRNFAWLGVLFSAAALITALTHFRVLPAILGFIGMGCALSSWLLLYRDQRE